MCERFLLLLYIPPRFSTLPVVPTQKVSQSNSLYHTNTHSLVEEEIVPVEVTSLGQ